MKKIKVAVLFGGRSTEHEISLLSAQNVVKALNKEKYEAILIGIDKSGKWHHLSDGFQLENNDDPQKIALRTTSQKVLFSQNADDHYFQTSIANTSPTFDIDVIFPVLHGMYGEDGAIQGMAKLMNLPCVGPGIIGSAVGMDKEVMKRLLRDSGIKSAPWISLRRKDINSINVDKIISELGSEVFVKPVNLGSSVGITFVTEKEDLLPAIEEAFKYDHKVLIEKRIIGREIECAVLGNDEPIASIPGEVIPKGGFYSFEAKYVDEDGAALQIPAALTEHQEEQIKQLSLDTFTLLECRGMARVDMFMTEDEELFINEINTIPGFTNISMYPTLWKVSGISNQDLVDRLIQYALEAHRMNNALLT